ncbi:hypothetical protein BD408DRAFT_83125 [Parasitella parasitica]|nr:hypothetical protein BD408DRAFT_83125 [Parasitella parasitica]
MNFIKLVVSLHESESAILVILSVTLIKLNLFAGKIDQKIALKVENPARRSLQKVHKKKFFLDVFDAVCSVKWLEYTVEKAFPFLLIKHV